MLSRSGNSGERRLYCSETSPFTPLIPSSQIFAKSSWIQKSYHATRRGKKKQTVALRLPKCHKENMINKHEPYRLNIEQRKLKVRRRRRKKKKVGGGGGGVVTKKQKVPRNLWAIFTWNRVKLSSHGSGINQIKIHFSKSVPRYKWMECHASAVCLKHSAQTKNSS